MKYHVIYVLHLMEHFFGWECYCYDIIGLLQNVGIKNELYNYVSMPTHPN